MNEHIQLILKDLVSQYGQQLCTNSRQLKALLLDLCGTNRLEINLLLYAVQENVVIVLLDDDSEVTWVMTNKLIKKLQNNCGISEEYAKWSIETWAKALEKNFDTKVGNEHQQATSIETPEKSNLPKNILTIMESDLRVLEELKDRQVQYKQEYIALSNIIGSFKYKLNIGDLMYPELSFNSIKKDVVKEAFAAVIGNYKWNLKDFANNRASFFRESYLQRYVYSIRMAIYYEKMYSNELEFYQDVVGLEYNKYVDAEDYWKDELYFFSSKMHQQQSKITKEHSQQDRANSPKTKPTSIKRNQPAAKVVVQQPKQVTPKPSYTKYESEKYQYEGKILTWEELLKARNLADKAES
ncbi:hypothetical protein, partial [Caryophanon latum]|uniref:hypothetical protein n=1 Tax=Caryophanon latum TaxID=33977 RepID=UPI001B806FA3